MHNIFYASILEVRRTCHLFLKFVKDGPIGPPLFPNQFLSPCLSVASSPISFSI